MKTIPKEVIEKAIILACKNHFKAPKVVDKMIDYLYAYNGTPLSTKVKVLREIFNKHSRKSYEHQIEDIERLIERNANPVFRFVKIQTYFELVYEYYQSSIGTLQVKDDDKVLIDLDLSIEELKNLRELFGE